MDGFMDCGVVGGGGCRCDDTKLATTVTLFSNRRKDYQSQYDRGSNATLGKPRDDQFFCYLIES